MIDSDVSQQFLRATLRYYLSVLHRLDAPSMSHNNNTNTNIAMAILSGLPSRTRSATSVGMGSSGDALPASPVPATAMPAASQSA